LTSFRPGVEMPWMHRIAILAGTVFGALALSLTSTGVAQAQGVAPGGPIYNSTGIGGGTGGPIGTGPGFPNGTNQAPQPTISPPAIGGGSVPSTTPYTGASSTYKQPHTAAHRRPPSVAPIGLPSQASTDLGFLRGCWRTDVFQYEGQSGITTWCFNDKGAGRVLYSRINQPDYFCNAKADASYSGGRLYLHSLASTCSDNRALDLGDLNCQQNGEVVRCSGVLAATGPGERWNVGLYKVQR
jgi:hypothetical protein